MMALPPSRVFLAGRQSHPGAQKWRSTVQSQVKRFMALLLIPAVVGAQIIGSGAARAGAASTQMASRVAVVRPAAAKSIPGWPGGNAQYLGRYKIVKSSDPALAKSGQLTIFLRSKVPGTKGPILGGILAMTGSSGVNVVYLTQFKHTGALLSTVVNLGIYTGPVIGVFKVTAIDVKTGLITAKFVPHSGGPISLEFSRFSKNPQP
jgi:hypothetical protein